METQSSYEKGFSIYFSAGTSRGWKVVRDGPAVRIQLGRLAIGIMLADLEGMILWALAATQKVKDAIGSDIESKNRVAELEAKIKRDEASYLNDKKTWDDLRLEAEAAGDRARQDVKEAKEKGGQDLKEASEAHAREMEEVRRQAKETVEKNEALIKANDEIAVLKEEKEELEMEKSDAEDAADAAKAKLEEAKTSIETLHVEFNKIVGLLLKED